MASFERLDGINAQVRETKMSLFPAIHRRDVLTALTEQRFDIAVVGGGITGTAVARACARAGYDVALVEKGDFASGTSSRSSRLIHGGFRYLQHGRIGMVRHCLSERARLLSEAPHLVRPIPFLLPLRGDAPHSVRALRAGMAMYRALCVGHGDAVGGALDAEQTLALEPALDGANLVGALRYNECLTHDARLTLSNALDAAALGARAVNYARTERLIARSGKTEGIVVVDQLTGERLEVRARVVVDATGPWSGTLAGGVDRSAVRLSKGAHIVVPRDRLPLNHAVAFFSPSDGRALFAAPQANFVCIGTTDTLYSGAPEDAVASVSDVAYLLDAARGEFPACALSPDDIVDTWAGLRPLADSSDRDTTALRRDYRIESRGDGLVVVVGGKMTLHRAMAERVVRRLSGLLRENRRLPEPVDPHSTLLPRERTALAETLRRHGLPLSSCDHILDTYDVGAMTFPALLRENPVWAEPIVSSLPFVWAEIPYAIRCEMAVAPEDFVRRRTDFAVQCAAARQKIPVELYALWERESRRFR